MWVIESSELSGAAIQVDKTWPKCWQETKAVINCNDTKWTNIVIINNAECWSSN